MMLYLYGKAKTDYFCAIDDVESVLPAIKRGIVEIMIHPTYSDDSTLIDAENRQNLIELLKPLGKYTLTSYATLKASRRPKFLNIQPVVL
jgi:hypothetical protein